MNTIWERLGIEQTDNQRLIKKAYALKLRETKPDEKPDEFQDLYFSYKQALYEAQVAAENSQQDEVQSSAEDEFSLNLKERQAIDGQDPTQMLSDTPAEPAPGQEQLISSQSEGHTSVADKQGADELLLNQIDKEVERMMERVEAILENDLRYDVACWPILLESTYILESDYFWKFSASLFTRIAKYYNSREYAGQGDYRISYAVIKYLAITFRWCDFNFDVRDSIYDVYGKTVFDKMLNDDLLLDKAHDDAVLGLRGGKAVKKITKYQNVPLKLYYFAGNISRFFALLFDFIFASIIYVMVYSVTEPLKPILSFKDHYNGIMFYVIFLIMAWLFESSKYQATPGKLILGLKVTNKNNEKLGSFHALFRTIIFAASCFGFYLTLIFNIVSRGKYLHDILSRSRVIDMRRSRKERL